jgi:hypothetical protein
LHRYLEQHPEIYMAPAKETNFFALEGEELDFRGPRDMEVLAGSGFVTTITDLGDYEEQFAGARGESALGETCPLYLYSGRAPRRIKHHVPEVRLIAVLRDPAERAYSAFTHLVRDNREVPDFARALELEDERVRENYPWIFHYRRMGYYHEQLSRYYELFEEEQIKVYLYEELSADPAGTLQDMYSFLGVDDAFVPDTSARHNVSGVPRNRLINEFLRRQNPLKSALRPLLPAGLRRKVRSNVRRRNIAHAPPLPPEVRVRLVDGYREDVEKLQGLIGRDLSGWLQP